MVDEAKVKEATADCLAAVQHSSDPKATINEFCAVLMHHKGWSDVDAAVVKLRVRRSLFPPR